MTTRCKPLHSAFSAVFPISFVIIFAIFSSQILRIPPLFANTTPAAVDVMFVIDNSGSMRKNDPGFLTPEIVKAFLGKLGPRTRAGMILFDESARLLHPLGPVHDPKIRQGLTAGLDRIDYKGRFTNSAAGIERALYELKTRGRDQARHGIIFLTDGIIDTGNRQKDTELTQWLKNDLAEACRRRNIRIFGIAFTENADFTLIQALAARTAGAYFRAYKPDDITVVLEDIQNLIQQSEPDAQPIDSPELKVPAVDPLPQLESSAAAEPEPQADERIAKGAGEAQNSNNRGFFAIALLALGIVAYLIYKYRLTGGPSLSKPPMPAKKAPVLDEKKAAGPPQWQLQDLSRPENPPKSFDRVRVSIGRDTKNDFVIARQTVSNLHALIEFKEGAFFLEDLRSTNGTRLNDRRIISNSPVRLKSGDRISFASHEYKFIRMDQLISGDTIMLSVTELESAQDEPELPSPNTTVKDENNLAVSLSKHLDQIVALGIKYKTFVDHYFPKDIVRTLSIQAHENMQQTKLDGDQHCSPLIKGRAFYVVCTLPVAIAEVPAWFEKRFGGFTKFIHKWIRSKGYDVAASDVFCIVTFGFKESTWVSMTIVPTREDNDDVEIMSVDFLTEQEKVNLALDFDDHGRVI